MDGARRERLPPRSLHLPPNDFSDEAHRIHHSQQSGGRSGEQVKYWFSL
jgi:hypothetical protein